jgi:hypothetical protein
MGEPFQRFALLFLTGNAGAYWSCKHQSETETVKTVPPLTRRTSTGLKPGENERPISNFLAANVNYHGPRPRHPVHKKAASIGRLFPWSRFS